MMRLVFAIQSIGALSASCPAGVDKHWAEDPINGGCVEACPATDVLKGQFSVLMGGQDHLGGEDEHSCANNGYSSFNSTEVVGSGELELALDRYDSDSGYNPAKNKCTLECTLGGITGYWGCAFACIAAQGPASCITAGCLAAVTAFDIPCLKKCNGDGMVV